MIDLLAVVVVFLLCYTGAHQQSYMIYSVITAMMCHRNADASSRNKSPDKAVCNYVRWARSIVPFNQHPSHSNLPYMRLSTIVPLVTVKREHG